jgi:hypothetical protein
MPACAAARVVAPFFGVRLRLFLQLGRQLQIVLAVEVDRIRFERGDHPRDCAA